MDRKRWVATALAVVLACTPPALAQWPRTEAAAIAAGAKRLGAADFTARYVGNTLSGKTSDGETFHVFVDSGSTYKMTFQGKSSTDRWHANKDGEFCATSGADTACTREYEFRGEIYSFNSDGMLAGTAQLRPGNPEKL